MSNEKRIPKTATESRRKNERGVILLLGTLSMPVLVSMLGLGIDASIVYATKSKIQLAADGAALAAARALSLGLTTADQALSAQNNATNWFNKNFPPGDFGSSNTTLAQPEVYDDPVEPLIRHVVVTAESDAPSYFMRYWGRLSTRVAANSRATRRDSVIMMVLDRSGSMAGTPCTDMKAAAKQFTGMFSAERDRIGMITFNMGTNIAASPSTNFRTVLGYNEGGASGTGLIDGISCVGGTGTAQATILGYNELYKIGLPGALNVLLLFTDGVPTAMTFDFRGGSTNSRGILVDGTNCQDALGRSLNSGATTPGNMSTNPRSWTTGFSGGTGSWLADIGGGPNATVYADTGQSLWAYNYLINSTSANDSKPSTGASSAAAGCGFSNSATSQIEWMPSSDLFGNSLELPGYNSLDYDTYDGASRLKMNGTNFSLAALNASANAASRARTTRTLPDGRNFPGVFVYAIGLGSVNHSLLQRMANDPDADPGGDYGAFAGYDNAQPIGNYVYASDSSRLSAAFAQIASFILRLSQ